MNFRSYILKIPLKILLLQKQEENTLPLKSLLPLASVWSKTTLNTGGVGGTGADLQT